MFADPEYSPEIQDPYRGSSPEEAPCVRRRQRPGRYHEEQRHLLDDEAGIRGMLLLRKVILL